MVNQVSGVPDTNFQPKRGVGWKWVILLVLIVGAGAAAGTWYVMDQQARARESEIQKQIDELKAEAEGPRTITTDTFTLTLPAGWQEVAFDALGFGESADYEYVSYGDEAGNFFQVITKIPATEAVVDAAWTLSGDPKVGAEVADEGERCTKDESEFCAAGDGKLTIIASTAPPPTDSEPVASYTLVFGNRERETGVALQVFRDILESFRVK